MEYLLPFSLFYHEYIKTYKSIPSYCLMELIALLSTGKGTWGQVSGLIKRGDWEKIILLGDDFASKFSAEKPAEFIKINPEQNIKDLREELQKKLKGKINGVEVALSIASGNGKEHMALISALLCMPVGVRFAILTKEGIVNM